jgi:hypothetical protein
MMLPPTQLYPPYRAVRRRLTKSGGCFLALLILVIVADGELSTAAWVADTQVLIGDQQRTLGKAERAPQIGSAHVSRDNRAGILRRSRRDASESNRRQINEPALP